MIVLVILNLNNEIKEIIENNVNDKDEWNYKVVVEEIKINYDFIKENIKEFGKENEFVIWLENFVFEKVKLYFDDFYMFKLGIYDILIFEYGEKFDKEDV